MGRTKSTLVRRVVEAEFKDLGFRYTEAPTPQQKDGWSCGLMVIRNATRRMNGLSVGAWNNEPPSKRRKKTVEVVQRNAPDLVRSSNRLRKAAKAARGLK